MLFRSLADGGRQAVVPPARRAMQLPPALHSRLAGGPGAAEPLPVERDPAAGAPPFRFAARRVRFPREHEFFEVCEPRRERAVVGGSGAGGQGGGAVGGADARGWGQDRRAGTKPTLADGASGEAGDTGRGARGWGVRMGAGRTGAGLADRPRP